MVVLMTGAASALDLVVEEVEVDGTVIFENEVNRLDLVRDNVVDVEVLLRATGDVRDVELEVSIKGFEYNDFQAIRDASHVFDLDNGTRKRFRFQVPLSQDVDEDDYKLRLILADRNGDQIFQNYNLKLDVERHLLKVEDVVFSPAGEVQAGQALLAVVRVENQGEQDEDDVRVEVRIPELGVSGVDFIDEIEADEEEETEEIFMRLPLCAEAGTYEVEVVASYDESFEKTTARSAVHVGENPRCKAAEEPVTVVVEEQKQLPPQPEYSKSKIRSTLEVLLLVLVGLLVVVGLLIGFSRLKSKEEDF